MNPEVFARLAEVESRHWWYRGLRDLIARCLGPRALGLPPNPRLLDAGCGTGETLRFLRDRFHPSYLGGFDTAELALRSAREKVPDAHLFLSDVCDPVIPCEPLDLVISLDVISVPGSERARNGLERLVGALRHGGLLLLNLPAMGWLYSEHDEAVHASQRFVASEVRKLLRGLGLEVPLLSYRLFLLLPAVILARLPRLRSRPGGSYDVAAASDLDLRLTAPAERVLFGLLCAENRIIARGGFLPWGSSIFAVGRKP